MILKNIYQKQLKKLVIFASGTGTNALNIIKYFKNKPEAEVIAVFCNKPHAKVLGKAKAENVDTFVFDKTQLKNGDVLKKLQNLSPDIIILAGFLLKIPESIIKVFDRKIINVHPSLLPQYGGKGMYGMRVHQAVVEHKETETGISIHYVNEHYDEGAIIFQARCDVMPSDTAEDIASKIHKLEMKHFPKVIDQTLKEF